MINIEAKELDGIINAKDGALIIISILYEQGAINEKTYNNIMKNIILHK